PFQAASHDAETDGSYTNPYHTQCQDEALPFVGKLAIPLARIVPVTDRGTLASNESARGRASGDQMHCNKRMGLLPLRLGQPLLCLSLTVVLSASRHRPGPCHRTRCAGP